MPCWCLLVRIFFGVLMTTSGLSTLTSVSILLGVDAALLLFLLIGFVMARQPVLVETRKSWELLELLSDGPRHRLRNEHQNNCHHPKGRQPSG